MLNEKELKQLRKNAEIHKKIFKKINEKLEKGTSPQEINDLCGKIAKENNVLCGFKGVYGFPDNICISINDVVVHGRIRKNMEFKEGDLVTFDFGIKDKEYGVNTDAAFSVIIGGNDKNPAGARLIEANIRALDKGIEMSRAGNTFGDIGNAIETEIKDSGYKVVKELTGHCIGKKLHEKPYVYNYGKAGSGPEIKKGMVLCIEPILGETSGEIIDKGDWEIYIKDGSLGCQYEHTILITDGDPEIIV